MTAMIEPIVKWVGLISGIAAILDVLRRIWIWRRGRFDQKVRETIAHPRVNYQGGAQRTIRWDAKNISERLGKSEKSVTRTIRRLARQGEIEPVEGGWGIKE